MNKGTRVSWTFKDGSKGTGVTISHDDDEGGHVMVAVDPLPPAPGLRASSLEFHPVIWCTTTWLAPVTP